MKLACNHSFTDSFETHLVKQQVNESQIVVYLARNDIKSQLSFQQIKCNKKSTFFFVFVG